MSKMDCHLKDRFRMLSRKGRTALIAVAHSLAVILHRTLASGTAYREADQPADDRKKERLIRHQEGTSDSSLCSPAGRTRCRGAFAPPRIRYAPPLLGRNPNPPVQHKE
jgi:hypothetical protein